MSDKYFKFHFKNDQMDKSTSYDIKLNTFNDAMEYAYNKLDELNGSTAGYRIIGIYEIMGYKR